MVCPAPDIKVLPLALLDNVVEPVPPMTVSLTPETITDVIPVNVSDTPEPFRPAQDSVTTRAFSFKSLAHRNISDTSIGLPEN